MISQEALGEATLGNELPVRLEGLPQGVVRLGAVPTVRLVKREVKTSGKEKP